MKQLTAHPISKLLQILEDKLRKGLISSGLAEKEIVLDEDDLAIKVKKDQISDECNCLTITNNFS